MRTPLTPSRFMYVIQLVSLLCPLLMPIHTGVMGLTGLGAVDRVYCTFRLQGTVTALLPLPNDGAGHVAVVTAIVDCATVGESRAESNNRCVVTHARLPIIKLV